MGHHHSLLVLVLLTFLHTTVANYEWTGKEWRWVSSQRSSSRGDEDVDLGSGDDEEEGDGQEPPSGLVEDMVVFADHSTITIWWQPPSRETWNSCLIGYRIGYRKKSKPRKYTLGQALMFGMPPPDSDPIYETVEGKYEDKESGKDYFFEEVEGSNHSYVIRNLDSESTYLLGVQVFNPWGRNQNLRETEVTTKPGIPISHTPKIPFMFQSLALSRVCHTLTT